MGGRGAASGGWSGGGGGGGNPLSTEDLITKREGKREEVDQTLTVLRDINNQYGITVDTDVAIMPPGSTAMAYYDLVSGNVGVNNAYFDVQKMTQAYDGCVQSGFHPSRGNKTAMEAVVSHEMGHALTSKAMQRMGESDFNRAAQRIVEEARKASKYKKSQASMAAQISKYAQTEPAEAIAEAFADVYCNGTKANQYSQSIVSILNTYL